MAVIETPDDIALDELCDQLREMADGLGGVEDWPSRQLELCGQFGVYRWFLPHTWSGFDWSESDVIRGYLKLSAACLTTTFIITQRSGACRRILASKNSDMMTELLPGLASGETFATVGISHLTTSRRHLAKPALLAREVPGGFRLAGSSPWVTGAPFAQQVVAGATFEDGREILALLRSGAQGLTIAESHPLVALSASRTGAVLCQDVFVKESDVLSGPVAEVMKQGVGANTGGLQTSTLALGLSRAAIDYLDQQSTARPDLRQKAGALDEQWHQTAADLLGIAAGEPVCSNDELRATANSLALRCTQAALVAAKGAGFVAGHRVGRWCREALFFLVWSCPQNVLDANLCELAGIEG